MYEYRATLVRAIDGDTYVLDVDLGMFVHTHATIRLRGVNCPERGRPGGAEATKAARDWFAFTVSPVTIRTHKGDEHDKYGRWVADIISGSGSNLADHLLANGHGIAV